MFSFVFESVLYVLLRFTASDYPFGILKQSMIDPARPVSQIPNNLKIRMLIDLNMLKRIEYKYYS